MSQRFPTWATLKCREKIVFNPASLFAQSVAVVLSNVTSDGYSDLETISHLHFPKHRLNEPIKVIYKRECNIHSCWVYDLYGFSEYHDHTERLGHYKFWKLSCRRSRKNIIGVLPHHLETTVVSEVYGGRDYKRVSEREQLSCKRRLFE